MTTNISRYTVPLFVVEVVTRPTLDHGPGAEVKREVQVARREIRERIDPEICLSLVNVIHLERKRKSQVGRRMVSETVSMAIALVYTHVHWTPVVVQSTT